MTRFNLPQDCTYKEDVDTFESALSVLRKSWDHELTPLRDRMRTLELRNYSGAISLDQLERLAEHVIQNGTPGTQIAVREVNRASRFFDNLTISWWDVHEQNREHYSNLAVVKGLLEGNCFTTGKEVHFKKHGLVERVVTSMAHFSLHAPETIFYVDEGNSDTSTQYHFCKMTGIEIVPVMYD